MASKEKSNTRTLAQARRDLDKAFALYQSAKPFEDWSRSARAEIRAYAEKEYGSMAGLYNDLRIGICELLLAVDARVKELEAHSG